MTIRPRPLSVLLAALSIAVAGGGATYYRHGIAGAQAAAAPAAATEVDVAAVVSEPIVEWQSYSGRLEAIDKVEIRPLASGRIVAVHFADGATVKKGDLLFTIDPQPYAAALERAQAQVTAAEARAAYASSEFARSQRLLADNAVARRDYEEKRNASLEASAALRAARAAADTARIDLSYTRVTAPVSGRVSRAELTIGNIVQAGAATPLLTTVVSQSPIYASFDADEQTYLRYLRQAGSSKTPVYLGLADEDGYSRQGRIDSVDNQLDDRSGTIRVRARFDNGDNALLPGLYARVKVGAGTPRQAVLINEAAIGTDQAKRFVLVVDDANLVRYREVELGNEHDGMRVVTAGLQPGERVVIKGMQRVRPAEPVRPRLVDMTDGKPVATNTNPKQPVGSEPVTTLARSPS
ncbi:efflux transporter periplasmic adaptor subunit [Bordetella genomosp. 8]|uniref:Efflux transporter periplasmic adaptor subunit n=1 Tax=Bordetella genomosp. 8 TaxID=1416806 RepID=A0A1W6YL66_9BORD|nr:efflux RND transporter periplasmic adaptor subunit [Bordetella genomosp. 8]ARP81836.1 efflux transporter periplasmic adaptor subunit [Bordetella genomosp. 8]